MTLHILVLLLLLQAVSAIFGGAALALKPDGSMLELPVSWLAPSPFADYFIPGLVLFGVLGIFPLLTIYALLKRPNWLWPNYLNVYRDQYWGWSFATYVGFGLVVWIALEILFTRAADPLQTIYALLGTAISAWSLLPSVRNYYQRNSHDTTLSYCSN
jgi:hypothetical protein